MNQNKQEQIDKIKVSLKGELDSSNVDGDILYYNELSRGRVLNRLYKLFSKELAKVEQRTRQEAVEEYKKSSYYPFDGLEVRMMYRDGDKVIQNRHIFSLKQFELIKGISEVIKLKFSYMLKDLLGEALSLKKEQK